jgi:hypothetical protein
MDIPSLLKIGRDMAYLFDMKEDDPTHWCIAGGAVRDAMIGVQPKDIDFYALGVDDASYGPVENKNLEESDITVQLMHTKYKTPIELIRSFDWNICCCALMADGRLMDPINVRETIEHKEHLRLVNITNPFSNLRRGYRFSERYGLDLLTEDLMKLFKACIDGNKNHWSWWDPRDGDNGSRTPRPQMSGQFFVDDLANGEVPNRLHTLPVWGHATDRSIRDRYEVR